MRRVWLGIMGGWLLIAAAPTHALDTVTETFDDDPFWSTLNNTAVNDNYGYSPNTNHAGGSGGEAGGLFGRHDAFDSFYADTDIGGWLSARDPLHSSGKISIDTSLSPQFPMNISFFDWTKPDKGGNALRINIINGGQFMLWLRLKIGKNLQSPVTTGLVPGDYNWSMNWDPTGNNGLGTGTVTFNGVTPGTPAALSATLNIPVRNEGTKPEWLQEPIYFNAFGMQNYDAEATTSGQYRVYMDDVTYSVVSKPAATSAWGLTGSGAWANSLNWSPGEVPYGTDRGAVFGGSVTQNTSVFVDRDINVKSIQFDNPTHQYSLSGTGTIQLDADTGSASVSVMNGSHEIQARMALQGDATFSTNVGGTLEFDGPVALSGQTLSIAPGSNVRFQSIKDEPSSGIVNNAGTLGGGGRINGNLNNQSGGIVAPGNSTGNLRVDGAFMQSDAASLALEIGGTAVGAFDTLTISGLATLDGTLDVSLINAFEPLGGESFIVLSAAGGIINNGLLLSGSASSHFQYSIVGNNLLLSAVLAGDYNDDGTVDAADYTLWRDTLNSTADLRADGNRNGQIDAGDYATWKQNFGRSSGQGSGAAGSQAVPEPEAATLAIAALTAAFGFARRRGRGRMQLVAILGAVICGQPAAAEIIGNSFNVDPQWQGNDNILPQGVASKARDDFNNFGFNANTSNAFGAPGEIGGYFGMNTFDSYYADTTLGGNVGGSFPLKQTLQAGGKLMVNSGHSPTWNMNIGFFDSTDYRSSMTGAQESGGGDAVRFAIIEQTPNFRLRLEIRQQGNGYNGPVLAGSAGLLDGMYTWSMDYNPTGGAGGNGRLSLNMRGPTILSTFVDVDAAGKNIPMNLNSFGYTNYNSGVSRPDLNKHYTYLDDLSYSTNEVADTVVRWAGPNHGPWTDASSWQSVTRTDGAGFVPNGNDRKAVFAGGITRDTVVTVDKAVSINAMEFNNSTYDYNIVGTGTISLAANGGGDARIDVLGGTHSLQSEVSLSANTEVATAAGAALNLDNAIALNGNTLTIAGSGQVNFNNEIKTGGGSIVGGGSIGGRGSIEGDLASLSLLAVSIESSTENNGLNVSGTATLRGLIDISAVDLVQFSRGDRFVLLTAGRILDQGLELISTDAKRFELVIGPTSIAVQAIVPEPSSLATFAAIAIALACSRRALTRAERGKCK